MELLGETKNSTSVIRTGDLYSDHSIRPDDPRRWLPHPSQNMSKTTLPWRHGTYSLSSEHPCNKSFNLNVPFPKLRDNRTYLSDPGKTEGLCCDAESLPRLGQYRRVFYDGKSCQLPDIEAHKKSRFRSSTDSQNVETNQDDFANKGDDQDKENRNGIRKSQFLDPVETEKFLKRPKCCPSLPLIAKGVNKRTQIARFISDVKHDVQDQPGEGSTAIRSPGSFQSHLQRETPRETESVHKLDSDRKPENAKVSPKSITYRTVIRGGKLFNLPDIKEDRGPKTLPTIVTKKTERCHGDNGKINFCLDIPPGMSRKHATTDRSQTPPLGRSAQLQAYIDVKYGHSSLKESFEQNPDASGVAMVADKQSEFPKNAVSDKDCLNMRPSIPVGPFPKQLKIMSDTIDDMVKEVNFLVACRDQLYQSLADNEVALHFAKEQMHNIPPYIRSQAKDVHRKIDGLEDLQRKLMWQISGLSTEIKEQLVRQNEQERELTKLLLKEDKANQAAALHTMNSYS